MAELSSDFKELVRSQTEIVGLIGESLTLQSRGRDFVALCPFHNDTNPSMVVYPDRQTFRCWACQQGGDVFTWVMEREGLGFFEALKLLADRAHLEMPERSEGEVRQQAKKEEIYAALKWAELQFHEFFLKSQDAQDARDYISSRGYSDETVEQFRIGYHIDDWNWLQRRARGQFSAEVLMQAQLIRPQDDRPGHSDYFVDRVVWPIHDERKRTVAFGGRLIPGHKERGGKYFNSKESIVFQKSRVLYGLPFARDAIKERGAIVVVEGYADCVACHQFGVRNTVAGMGTALSEQQCQRLKAFAPKIVLNYDADQAGQDAAAKVVGRLLGQSVDLRVLSLPDGMDPDDFLAANGKEAFEQLIDRAPEAWEFRLEYEIKQNGNTSVDSQERVLNEMLTLLAQVPGLRGTAREDLILGRLSSRLRMQEISVRNQMDRMRSRSNQTSSPMVKVDPAAERETRETRIEFHRGTLSKDDKLESELLEILFVQPELAERARQEVGVDDFQNSHLKMLLQIVYDLVELSEEPTFDRVTLEIEESELKGLAVWVADQAHLKGVAQKLADPDFLVSSVSGILSDGKDADGKQNDTSETDVPGFFRENLNRLKWRREELSHQAYLNRQAMAAGEGEDDPLAKLKRATAFHRKRVSR